MTDKDEVIFVERGQHSVAVNLGKKFNNHLALKFDNKNQ